MKNCLMLLRDGSESRRELSVRRYFDLSYGIFLKRLKELKNLRRRLKPEEEKELRFMIDALIDAKHLLYDA